MNLIFALLGCGAAAMNSGDTEEVTPYERPVPIEEIVRQNAAALRDGKTSDTKRVLQAMNYGCPIDSNAIDAYSLSANETTVDFEKCSQYLLKMDLPRYFGVRNAFELDY